MTKIYVGYEYENKFRCGRVFCTGTLEDESDYDYVWVDKCGDIKTYEHIEDVVAVLPNGEERVARLFIWENYDSYAGLVVDVNDTEYLARAQKKFDEHDEDCLIRR